MVEYSRYRLDNGLTLIVNENHDTPLVTVNILYCVGSRNENPNRTGFAHLFEHLMFGGSKNAPDYDLVVSRMGGENNAFTNTDITNYYLTFPAEYLEEALKLEADRMVNLILSERSLEVQKRVVTEEYNQRYMNQPYGDSWMLLRDLCYEKHPYKWCTIGADIRHVQEATLGDVKSFYDRYYRPGNAIMAVAGNVDTSKVKELVERYFGGIPDGKEREYFDGKEPEPQESRRKVVERLVPATAIYMAWLMPGYKCRDYYVCDLLSDILSNGQSSRMYESLVKRQGLMSEVTAVITGEEGPGLFLVKGKLNDGVNIEDAERAIVAELECLKNEPVSEIELQKVKNKFENTFVFSQYKAADCAANLCYYEWLGHIEYVNTEPEQYASIMPSDLQRVARNIFMENRSRTLIINPIGEEENEKAD